MTLHEWVYNLAYRRNLGTLWATQQHLTQESNNQYLERNKPMSVLDQIEKTKAQLAELEKQYKAEQEAKEGNNPHVTTYGKTERCYAYIRQLGGLGSGITCLDIKGYSNQHNTNTPVFKDEKAAKDWAEALQVMIELRVQPGACSYHIDRKIHYYCVDVNLDGVIMVMDWNNPSNMLFSGYFVDAKAAQAAIDAVGKERIRKAAHTLAGVV